MRRTYETVARRPAIPSAGRCVAGSYAFVEEEKEEMAEGAGFYRRAAELAEYRRDFYYQHFVAGMVRLEFSGTPIPKGSNIGSKMNDVQPTRDYKRLLKSTRRPARNGNNVQHITGNQVEIFIPRFSSPPTP